ncbi:MAG: hypothetical protein UW74_C0036G0003 [Candidatus Giovannonibacteria bacterium GW2011_GWC2_44_8]|uniref:Uncharacterized protein n=2 Tax=Candidatus Giovannoniibacteriota TaxID=1752738 RepID=A0A0G1IRT4_9BACT|nr:MAG: hypothetical protein UW55_C0022G0002 [Candidatus Giovannonibacteria bacterium GW2011_GWA2_44_26]KKT77669.1 MAG: hypothetical protein UW74_C0036G0003 [Candidatus Giovannonibacteria bacterium GW2011_GWC2_44_8]
MGFDPGILKALEETLNQKSLHYERFLIYGYVYKPNSVRPT